MWWTENPFKEIRLLQVPLNFKPEYNMLSINPFGSEEAKRQILGDAGVTPVDEDYEIPDNDLSDFQNIISSTPVIPKATGNAVKTIIKDAGALLKDNQEAKAQQMNLALSDVMTKYNKEYGLDLHVDFGSLSKTLVACADTKKQKILQLYVSKIFRGIRPLILLNMISKLTLALDVLLSPDKLLNPNELSLTDLFLATDQILNYIEKLENMKNEILIDQEDLNLKQIAEENNVEYSDSDEEMVSNFMALFKKDNGIE